MVSCYDFGAKNSDLLLLQTASENFLGAFYPILTSTEVGIRSVRKGYIKAAKIYDADRLVVFRHVELPSSLPSIFGGIVAGIGFSWVL
ncbi:ABC transporter permease [Pseudoalteromonas obscura]|uniref:ABC transporter permease n=1 Tax=Pseudoalteromonas obscura TaxID=3048491 RepID=UPI003A97D1B8